MVGALLLAVVLNGPVPLDQVLTTADVALLNEALDLDDAQRLAMAQLIRDFDTDARHLRVQATAEARRGPLWDKARSDETAWRASTVLLASLRTQRNELVKRQSAEADAPLPSQQHLVELHRLVQEAIDTTRSLAKQHIAALQAAREGAPDLDDRFAEQRTHLLTTLDTDISLLLTGAQQTAWPAVRQSLLRGRRLRQLDMPGADINVRAWVHRAAVFNDPDVQQLVGTWTTEVDSILARIDAQQALIEHESEPARVAAACRERLRLEAIIADLAVSTAEQLAASHDDLTALAAWATHRAFPASHARTTLHQLERASRTGDDTELAAEAAIVLERYRVARSEVLADWLEAERRIGLNYFNRACAGTDISDAEAQALVELSGTFQTARFTLINRYLKELQRKIPPARIERALPGIKLPSLR
jgi:hypothetical protein